ncbi:hypothetical protein NPIL_620871 [Nephila pilipes]|uniref:Uncharacterized protein n=1 Tax=Nephila pilipes TaxID=299642 RepID=A0A8X6T739_NEPPI|nr:hypothetical protein NPIL_620871 [Nephila pilipes]
MFIIFESYLPSFYHIIGYALVTEAIKYCILSLYFKEKLSNREIPVLTREQDIEVQLTPSEISPELTFQRKDQMKHNEITPKAYSENICNALNIETQLPPLEKSNNQIMKHNRELKHKTPPFDHSVVVYKICLGLNLDAQLRPLKTGCASITDMQQKTKTKKIIPMVHSVFIFNIFRALDLTTVLASPLN